MNTDETKTLNELKDFLENINFVVEDIDERTIIILYYGNRDTDNFYNTVKALAFDNDFTYYTPP